MTQTAPSDTEVEAEPPRPGSAGARSPDARTDGNRADGNRADGKDNDDYPWDAFDSTAYFNHNYRFPRDDDREILGEVRDFFTKAGVIEGHGVDVGSGANLYPTLSMLPMCRRITLWERSRSNVVWLRKQLRRHGPAWDQFWGHLAAATPYREMAEPWAELQHRARVRCNNIFRLPEKFFDIGTMFFVAESISTQKHEFEDAVYRFVGSLTPGAPFAAAFMLNSTGYRVGDIDFPAVPVSPTDVRQCVAETAFIQDSFEIGKGDKPLRDGYDGMILVTGWRL